MTASDGTRSPGIIRSAAYLADWHDGWDARFLLESLPATEVLRCIARIMADVYPYRPSESQVIIAAAKCAREELPAGTEVPG